MAITHRLRAETTITLTWIGGALRMGACAYVLNLLNAQRIAAIWPQTMNQCQYLGLTPSRQHGSYDVFGGGSGAAQRSESIRDQLL